MRLHGPVNPAALNAQRLSDAVCPPLRTPTPNGTSLLCPTAMNLPGLSKLRLRFVGDIVRREISSSCKTAGEKRGKSNFYEFASLLRN